MDNKIIIINNNINLHYLNDIKYKTNFVSVFLTMPLNKESVTKNALIPAILRRGTKRLDSMKKIEMEMEEMYGSTIDCGLDKSGKNQILKFYIESIKDEYVNDNVFEKSVQNISEMILDPVLKDGLFLNEYVEQEKNTLEIVINDKINDKTAFAMERCIEEMYNKDEYGIYVYGYTNDLNNISNEDIYNQYIDVLKTAKIDIFAYTNKEEKKVIELINKYFVNGTLNFRNEIYSPQLCNANVRKDEKNIIDMLDVVQGKLMIGINIQKNDKFDMFDIIVCNAILGVGCNSKIFRNVREREHLVYSAGSSYIPSANMIIIKAGIEVVNYEKAIQVIKEQIEETKNGVITQREIEDAKLVITSNYKSLYDDQYKIVNYYMNQNILLKNTSIDNMIENINNVKVDKVIEVANSLKINTIYFLKNK